MNPKYDYDEPNPTNQNPTAVNTPTPTLTLSSIHYVLTVSVGTTTKLMHPVPVLIYTGSGYNDIRRKELPDNWN